MTEAEAAKELGISIGSMRNLRKRGEIGFVKILNRIYYTPDQLIAFVESHRVEPSSQQKPLNPQRSIEGRRRPQGDDPTSRAIVSEIVRKTFKQPKIKLSGGFRKPEDAE